MSQETEKISNYESEAVQKNKAVMKSKFAERYQRMQDRKNDRGAAPNFNTFVTNAVDKPGVTGKEKIVVADIKGPEKIKAGEIATYTIVEYKGGTPDEAQKKKFLWSVYIDGKKENRVRLLFDKKEAPEPTYDLYSTYTTAPNPLLGASLMLSVTKTPLEDKIEIQFSKWLDGRTILVEAHYGINSFDKTCQQQTKIEAKPEILEAYWCDAHKKKIQTAGYQQEVYLCINSIGLLDTSIPITVHEDDDNIGDEHIAWKNNMMTIAGRYSYKKFHIPKEEHKKYVKQRGGFEGNDLELYFKLPNQTETTGWQEKFGKFLILSTEEKIPTAYFAEKKEIEDPDPDTTPDTDIETQSKPTVIATPAKPSKYTVVKGDTLAKIAKKKGIPYPDIMEANPNVKWEALIPNKTILTIPVKKESTTTEDAAKKPKTITYYKKIDTASLGSEVHLVAEALNLEGKTITFTVFEKEPILGSTTDTPLPLLVGDTEQTKIKATVKEGKAQVKVTLQRKADKAKEEWKDKLSPKEKEVPNTYHDNVLNQSIYMTSFDFLLMEPDRYTPVVETVPAKKTCLWLLVTCEGDQLDFSKSFLKKSNTLEVDYKEETNCKDPWDSASNKRIKKLHPSLRCPTKNFINNVEKELGIKLRVVSGYRSFSEQTKLYNQGRTKSGDIVTNAKAGKSYHNYGLAIDVCEIKNGKANWSLDMYEKVSPYAKKEGFTWGGDWKSFKDNPHFNIINGKTTSDLLKLYNENGKDYTKIKI